MTWTVERTVADKVLVFKGGQQAEDRLSTGDEVSGKQVRVCIAELLVTRLTGNPSTMQRDGLLSSITFDGKRIAEDRVAIDLDCASGNFPSTLASEQHSAGFFHGHPA